MTALRFPGWAGSLNVAGSAAEQARRHGRANSLASVSGVQRRLREASASLASASSRCGRALSDAQ